MSKLTGKLATTGMKCCVNAHCVSLASQTPGQTLDYNSLGPDLSREFWSGISVWADQNLRYCSAGMDQNH